ncbi:conjugal transfer protein TrbH [Verminephrobacter aporrectodeae subsp. tuberculatae]|uniref:Conjugal transfer protein TrbH n=1 Tax=Verminephrobacter aporrectodeae subsp. tuberculatae TaxID=1110392 RepID=A0ABT3KQT3_9BURK|nr:conjugal transfer protein TrbH [Verminephrobacter aporrectodeae]MCW5320684.1 conjugal transfer protein TrbH [Verminephrobacter aporrectodeae subsp. tuberculatae]MCW8200283.1 conjugal transfer protein TrbH [Verminephrobacter aporrectodeae subsp. tuberculatae]
MKPFRVILPLVAALFLNACAKPPRPTTSYVDPEVTANDAQTLSRDTVQHLSEPLPPAHTTLVLDPPHSSDDMLTADMIGKLRARGYGIAQTDPQTGPKAGQGTPLRYLASPLNGGVVLRLQYLDREATKFYPRTTDGNLMADAPFTVREKGAANEQ